MAVRFTRASSQYWSRASGAVLDFNKDYTFMAWVYLTSNVGSYYSFFGTFGNSDQDVDALQTTSAGNVLNIYCQGSVGSTTTLDATGSTLEIGKWYHLALVRERLNATNSMVRAYLNAVQNIAGAHDIIGSSARPASTKMYVGSWFSTLDYANGRVAHVKAFQAALHPLQIRAEMESAKPDFAAGLWGWWPAWERAAGLRNLDWSGNGYGWTETATPTDEDDPPTNLSSFLIPIIAYRSEIAVTVNAVAGTAAAAGVVPTLSAGLTITAVSATAPASAIVPTVSAGASVTAVIATAAAASASAPGVSVTSNVAVASVIGAAPASAPAPAVSDGSNVTITGVASAAGIAPSVTVTSNVTLTAIVGTAVAAGVVPTLSAGLTITGVSATAPASAVSPSVTVTSNVTVTGVIGTAAASAPTPGVSVGVSVTVTGVIGAATTAGVVPTLSTGLTITSVIATSAAAGNAPVVTLGSGNHAVLIGDGYSDVTPRQIIRTSGNRVWAATWKFDTFPHGGIGGGNYNAQTLKMYKADQVGTPSTFSRMDSAHEPAGVVSWAMAIDGADVIHVVWAVRATWSGLTDLGTDNYLRYCQFSTSTGLWGTVENVETSMGTRENGQDDELVSIALDANSVPHIVYLKDDGTRRRVLYRTRSGGSWSSATTVDDQTLAAGQACWHPGIAFDDAGRIVVTWMRGSDLVSSWSTTDARYFIRVYNGSWGTTHDVAGAALWNGIDNGTPIYIDAAGRYHTCYLNTSKYAQYSYSDNQGASWSANHPGSGTAIGDDPTPGPGASGKVRIYLHGIAADSFPATYFEGDGGEASWGTRITYANNHTPNDCSVNVRWSRYWWWYPSLLDVIYWQSNYPTNALYLGVDNTGTDVLIIGTTGATSAAGVAPSVAVAIGITVTSVAGAASAAAIAPSISTTSNVTIAGVVGTAAAAGITPSLSTSSALAAVAGAADASAIVPTVSAGASVTAVSATAAATGIAPAISTTSSVMVAGVVGTAAAAGITPSLSTSSALAAVAGAADASAIVPTVSAGASVTAVSATAAATGIAPAISTTSSVMVAGVVGTASAAAISPIVVTSGSVVVSAISATAPANALAPALSTSSNLTVISATATASAPVPAAGSGVTGEAFSATATASAIGPTLSASSTLLALVGTATASALAPNVATSSNISIAALMATASTDVLAPIISASSGTIILAVAGTALAALPAPAITATRAVTISGVAGLATAYAPAPWVILGEAVRDRVVFSLSIDREREFDLSIDRERRFDLEF